MDKECKNKRARIPIISSTITNFIFHIMNWLKKCNYIPFWKRNSIPRLYGITLAMWWIKNIKRDVPKYLRHDPSIQDEIGFTCAMWWLIKLRTDVPEYLRHDPSLQNAYGETCSTYWREYVNANIPEYLTPIDNN